MESPYRPFGSYYCKSTGGEYPSSLPNQSGATVVVVVATDSVVVSAVVVAVADESAADVSSTRSELVASEVEGELITVCCGTILVPCSPCSFVVTTT